MGVDMLNDVSFYIFLYIVCFIIYSCQSFSDVYLFTLCGSLQLGILFLPRKTCSFGFSCTSNGVPSKVIATSWPFYACYINSY